jgi:hypothetical protein
MTSAEAPLASVTVTIAGLASFDVVHGVPVLSAALQAR